MPNGLATPKTHPHRDSVFAFPKTGRVACSMHHRITLGVVTTIELIRCNNASRMRCGRDALTQCARCGQALRVKAFKCDVEHYSQFQTFMTQFLWVPSVGAFCGYLLWVPSVGTFCGYLLWVPSVGTFCGCLLTEETCFQEQRLFLARNYLISQPASY